MKSSGPLQASGPVAERSRIHPQAWPKGLRYSIRARLQAVGEGRKKLDEVMTALEDLPYSIAAHDIIAEADGMRVQIMTLGAGEAVPWHYHTKVTDVFVGLEGTVVIEIRAPRACYELEPGDHCVVPPLTAHRVSGKDGRGCRVTLVQGVGEHDFIPVGRAAARD